MLIFLRKKIRDFKIYHRKRFRYLAWKTKNKKMISGKSLHTNYVIGDILSNWIKKFTSNQWGWKSTKIRLLFHEKICGKIKIDISSHNPASFTHFVGVTLRSKSFIYRVIRQQLIPCPCLMNRGKILDYEEWLDLRIPACNPEGDHHIHNNRGWNQPRPHSQGWRHSCWSSGTGLGMRGEHSQKPWRSYASHRQKVCCPQ